MNRAIAWFARNGVAANLLMIVIIGGGLMTLFTIKEEIFPETSTDMVTISMRYRGAAPEEVEEAVCVRIEEQVQGLENIKRITSTAVEGQGVVSLELEYGSDVQEVLDEVKSRIDAIETFPDETDKPVIQELVRKHQVINIAVTGDTDEKTLKRIAERVRDDLTGLPDISIVELASARNYEVSIEVSEAALRRHGLTFDQVAAAVRRSSVDLPGGSIKTTGGEILVRSKGQAYVGEQFADLVLLSRADGTRLTVGDVATVNDGFEDTDQAAYFDGKRAILLQVSRVGRQGALDVAGAVKEYVAGSSSFLPEGIELTLWRDFSRVLESRIDLLLRNGRNGFILVFLVLALFLRFRLAFWASFAIPVSFLGAIWMMPGLDVSINMISLFAFIVVLGIVVDDAIIIGENIYTHQARGEHGVTGAINGAQRVAVPVVFAIATSIAAFFPLANIEGMMGRIMRVIPFIVIPTLIVSLVESLFILPSHLSHERTREKRPSRFRVIAAWSRFQDRFAERVQWFIHHVYRPALEVALRWRYLTVAWGVMTLLVAIGIVGGGWVRFTFMPNVEADNVVALLTMPQGTPAEATTEAVRHLQDAAEQVKREFEQPSGSDSEERVPVFRHVLASVGEQPTLTRRMGPGARRANFAAAHLGEVNIELVPSEDRAISAESIKNRWRELTGTIPDAVELSFTSTLFSVGDAINVQLASADLDQLRVAADSLKATLADYPGVTEISDSYRAGKQEIKLHIKPAAEALGLTLVDLARQVRQGFYGEEAQRIQRGRDDVRVMVRYPESGRRSLDDLERMRIRTPRGDEVPFSTVAAVERGHGFATINRADRRRTINITADVDESVAVPNEIIADLKASALPQLRAENPGLSYSLEGEQKEQAESMAGLRRGFLIALMVIYALLAIPFRSYVQPLLVMSAIPFGFVGALFGHIVMGYDLSILSMFGLVALAGVLVNDSLVLVDVMNRRRREGADAATAVIDAGIARFRAILLTSLTTFAGLTPLMLERSLQARFLIPMGISLAFGVMSATFITLMLIPSGYLIIEDIRALLARLASWLRRRVVPAEGQPDALGG